ncbi:hypothetical protein FK220_000875 [Flavobacteriaceae bacterium TP-CH-4]|uniref:YdhG-like domain-containing protein n=1 Tax=Pelagihabitans pacificus TaxID=2696054 RepID=A0A967E5A7_9FLAO|nr:DUF1801 domain-containing protein [Pelagihabitans pacificus]NHF57874.1 hypothetical protein [Pelagihabitans pacificus]
MEMLEKVEAYFEKDHPFKEGIAKLRELALKTDLEETYKWSLPTYTINNKNVLGICRFKKHFGIWFFNGVFLKDEKNVLENAQEGKTQAMRHWKFFDNDTIDETMVLSYMNEAIENEKKGIKLMPKTTSVPKVIVPQELTVALKGSPDHKKSFENLSPSKQKEYAEFISTAKRTQTRQSRLKKILPMILDGKGLNDHYR